MIEIIASTRPFDRSEGELASLPLFEDQRPLRRALGLVDWRMNGRISRLIEDGRLGGRRGESIFMPTGGRLKSEALMLVGFGAERGGSEDLFDTWIEKLRGLKKESWLLSFSSLADDFPTWKGQIMSFVRMMATGGEGGCRRLVLAENKVWVTEAHRRGIDFGEGTELSFET